MEYLYLLLRNAIASKESITASANHDVAKFGEWQFNYAENYREVNEEIERIVNYINEADKLYAKTM